MGPRLRRRPITKDRGQRKAEAYTPYGSLRYGLRSQSAVVAGWLVPTEYMGDYGNLEFGQGLRYGTEGQRDGSQRREGRFEREMHCSSTNLSVYVQEVKAVTLTHPYA